MNLTLYTVFLLCLISVCRSTRLCSLMFSLIIMNEWREVFNKGMMIMTNMAVIIMNYAQ